MNIEDKIDEIARRMIASDSTNIEISEASLKVNHKFIKQKFSGRSPKLTVITPKLNGYIGRVAKNLSLNLFKLGFANIDIILQPSWYGQERKYSFKRFDSQISLENIQRDFFSEFKDINPMDYDGNNSMERFLSFIEDNRISDSEVISIQGNHYMKELPLLRKHKVPIINTTHSIAKKENPRLENKQYMTFLHSDIIHIASPDLGGLISQDYPEFAHKIVLIKDKDWQIVADKYLNLMSSLQNVKLDYYVSLNKGIHDFSDKDYNMAIMSFETAQRAADNDQDRIKALIMVGRCFKENKQYGHAARIFKTILDNYIDQDISNAKYHYGSTMRLKGDYKVAKAFLNEIVTDNPTHTWALFNLGRACQELGQEQDARQHFSKVLEIDPNFQYASNIRK